MDDVVEHRERARWHPPRWLRGCAIVAALGLAIFVVTRPGLLSADRPGTPASAPQTPAPPSGHNTSQGISVVVRQGTHLERYEAGSGSRPLAALPPGLADPAPLVQAQLIDGSGPLVGVDHGVLFRISPVSGRSVRPIGLADRVLAQSPEPGRLYVVQSFEAKDHQPRVVEIDASTGNITSSQPFPGYDASTSWRPADVVSSPGGGSALLLTRPAGGNELELALAWDGLSIHFAGAPTLARIGFARQLLGVAQTRILTMAQASCAGGNCPITVLNVTRDRVSSQTVQPPSGWTYGTTVGGDAGDPIAVVAKVGNPSLLALARLLIGERQGRIVVGSVGLDGSVRPVDGSEGSVVFAVPRPEGDRLSVWLPGSPSAALLVDLPALKAGGEPICACR
jgi:hypothetical protein